jgi:hypothetical protein
LVLPGFGPEIVVHRYSFELSKYQKLDSLTPSFYQIPVLGTRIWHLKDLEPTNLNDFRQIFNIYTENQHPFLVVGSRWVRRCKTLELSSQRYEVRFPVAPKMSFGSRGFEHSFKQQEPLLVSCSVPDIDLRFTMKNSMWHNDRRFPRQAYIS